MRTRTGNKIICSNSDLFVRFTSGTNPTPGVARCCPPPPDWWSCLPSLKEGYLNYKLNLYVNSPSLTRSTDLVIDNCLVNGIGDTVSVRLQVQVVQQVNTGVKHRNRIGQVLSSNGSSRITSAWLEHGVMVSVIPSGQQSSSTNNATDHVGHNRTVQVGHDHHVELFGSASGNGSQS